MKREYTPWLYLGVAVTVTEAVAIARNKGTWTVLTREIFRTNTPLGRAAFAFTTVGAATWWLSHVLEGQR